MKRTLVLGATTNPERVANTATLRLRSHGHEVALVGIREGEIDGVPILIGRPKLADIDTVTLYLGAERQKEYYDYVLDLSPKRIIFNPGTENPELEALAQAAGIQTEEACTLVLLSIGQY
jgi:uncharacterized protein